jgi:hypothetical protein
MLKLEKLVYNLLYHNKLKKENDSSYRNAKRKRISANGSYAVDASTEEASALLFYER